MSTATIRFQNPVFLMLTTGALRGSTRVHFWRTKDKAEVDFVLEKGKSLIPFEVKYKPLKEIEIPRSLTSFCERYEPAKAFVVNLSLKKETKIGKTTVFSIPFWELLQMDI